MNKIFKNPIILAVDVNSLKMAKSLVSDLKDYIGGVKLGMEFFNSFGPKGVKDISNFGVPIFLDLKLHDIPVTVYKTVKTLMDLDIAIINVHSSGGKDMMKAAVRARNEYKDSSTKIIAVTVLTSLDDQDLNEIGFINESQDLVLKLAKLTKESGLDGIVCSAKEISLIKNNIGKDFTLVVTGIRLNSENLNDQKRVMSPGDAIKEGADLLVIGRPITDSHSPIDTINEILNQIDL
mgnify:FL=1